MTSSPKERTIGLAQFLAIIIAVVLVFVAWDFGRRVLDTMALAEKDTRAGQQMQNLEQIHTQLVQTKSDVTTDAFAERYARENWHWTREGETLFVPLATPVATPTPVPTVASPASDPKPFWGEFLDRLYEPAP